MALRSLLAKDWVLEVDTSATVTPTWTPVKGLTKFTEDISSSMKDDSDFDSNGWGSDVVTQRKWKLSVEGNRKRTTAATYVPDPGQEKIRTAGLLVGITAGVNVRWYRKDGTALGDAYSGFGTVDYGGGGGAVDDLEPFNFTVNGQGEPLAITNPTP